MNQKIIDRTLPEICERGFAGKSDLTDLCLLMKEMGIDLFEINFACLDKMVELPGNIDFIYRVESERDAELCRQYGIRECVLSEDVFLNSGLLKGLVRRQISITVEAEADTPEEVYALERLGKSKYTGAIDCIRIMGLSRCDSASWVMAAHSIGKALKTAVDICPVNRFYCATATAVEAFLEGLDSITVTFTGYGGKHGFAPLEEVLAAIEVFEGAKAGFNLRLLPQLCGLFNKMTGIAVPDNKPVLGKSIFKYESGIHADGIQKNPLTYEPFAPEMVGQQRSLTIGKHSGTGAIAQKLQIDFDPADLKTILENVRKKSIGLKRSLTDQELKEICMQVAGSLKGLQGEGGCI
ncbi:MAG: citramalate synthase [Clostridiales bacterium]|jgi:homocitrate synthase NifV|nr:citramalate synthase [Eubacteriales bacterium]MDH7567194.1 citramalate synthase [Clostridiales bacterium]